MRGHLLDEDHAAHVILRNPVLAAGHLAQQPVSTGGSSWDESRRSSQRSHRTMAGAVKVMLANPSMTPSPWAKGSRHSSIP